MWIKTKNIIIDIKPMLQAIFIVLLACTIFFGGAKFINYNVLKNKDDILMNSELQHSSDILTYSLSDNPASTSILAHVEFVDNNDQAKALNYVDIKTTNDVDSAPYIEYKIVDIDSLFGFNETHQEIVLYLTKTQLNDLISDNNQN